MPTYEFRCPAGHKFDHFFRKISDSLPEMPCPTCGAVAVRAVSGGAGLLFKGSGFYITDYGKDGKKDQKTQSSSKSSSKNSASGSSGDAPAGGDSGSSGSESPKTESSKPAESDKASGNKSSSSE